MQCQICKVNQVSVNICENVSGENGISLMLCMACAKKLGLDPESIDPASVSEVLKNLKAAELPLSCDPFAEYADTEDATNTRCPVCGISGLQLCETRRFGCGTCYEAFADLVEKVLPIAQRGCSRHVGGRGTGVAETAGDAVAFADSATPADNTAKLRHELAGAIAAEDYERAAAIRDTLMLMDSPAPVGDGLP